MRIVSPISNLREVLGKVQESARAYAPTLKTNEDATRAALVDPVLHTLGWDTANPNMVEVETKLSNHGQSGAGLSRLDYALYDTNRNVKCIIEAKALSQPLGPHLQQLVQYAFAAKIANVFLTDGVNWQHYTNFNPTNFQAAKAFNLSTDDHVAIATYFVQHLDAAIYWPIEPDVDVLAQEVSQLRSDNSTLQQQAALLRADLTVLQQQVKHLLPPGPPPPPPPPLPCASVANMTALGAISNAAKTKPSSLCLPDNTLIKVSYWRDVSIEMIKFVLAQVNSIPVPLPDRAGRTVNLIDAVPPPKGIDFVTESYNGQTIYIRTTYSADGHISNALHILNLLPQSQQVVQPSVVYA